MYPDIFIVAVDPHLGRLDYNLLSDQALMEMLYEGFDDKTKQKYQDEHGMYRDVCEWSCVECDKDERVIGIKESQNADGPLRVCYIPPKVSKFRIHGDKLTGSIDTADLPRSMIQISLSGKQLTGSLDLTELPENITGIYLNDNKLSGSIHLTKLPKTMKKLSLYLNKFTGSIDLRNLPDGMRQLFLHKNQLSGSLHLSHLPREMSCVILQRNLFTGPFIATDLPPRIHEINAIGNKFDEKAVVDSKTEARILLQESGVKTVVDENGAQKVKGVSL